jgi:hypothetical protein
MVRVRSSNDTVGLSVWMGSLRINPTTISYSVILIIHSITYSTALSNDYHLNMRRLNLCQMKDSLSVVSCSVCRSQRT